jgi:hypothetical protein
MIWFRILLVITGAGLAGLLIAFLVTRDRRHLRGALWFSGLAAALALLFFVGLFISGL